VRAREVLAALAADPLCEAQLRATIARRLAEIPQPVDERADDRPALLSSRL
jgi:hypothetical protein